MPKVRVKVQGHKRGDSAVTEHDRLIEVPDATSNMAFDSAGTAVADPLAGNGDSGVSPEVSQRKEQLQAAMKSIMEDGRVVEYLQMRGQMRQYSFNNTIMLLWQMPKDGKGMFASYNAWQQMGRQVNKGEKALGIWIPVKFKKEKKDRDGKPILDEQGKKQFDEHLTFKWKNAVFDVSQTDGPEFSAPKMGPIKGSTEERVTALRDQMMDVCDRHKITVEEDDTLQEGLYGYYQRDSNRIVINSKLSDEEKATTLAHEVSHAFDPDLKADPGIYRHTRPDCEAVAEATAHVISGRYGIDTSEHSGGYLTGWLQGDTERLETVMKRVDAITKEVLPPSDLDNQMSEANKKAKAVAQEKAKERKAKSSRGKKKRSTSRKKKTTTA